MSKILFKFNLLQDETNPIITQNKITDDSILVELEINKESIGLIPFKKIPKMIEKKPHPEHYNLKPATYNQIKEFVLQEYGKVHTRYISEIKKKIWN